MSEPAAWVHPKLEFVPPQFNRWVLRLVYLGLPVILRWRLRPWLPSGLRQFDIHNLEQLVTSYAQFKSGKIRLIFAFRHCEIDDPLAGLYLLSRAMPRQAKRQGVSIPPPYGVHFMYERGMALWAGNWLNWLFSRLGGIPIHRGKRPDWVGLKAARSLLVNGQFPLALAPEGATNGHSEKVSPLEPGVAQLGFWALEDLKKAGRQEAVVILPVGLQYHYPNPPWNHLAELLTQLEHACGLAAPGEEVAPDALPDMPEDAAPYYRRIRQLAQHLLTTLEAFYQRFYHRAIAPVPNQFTSLEEQLEFRLKALLNNALEVAEGYFGLASSGVSPASVIDRCRRVEEAGWSYIYREDLETVQPLSLLDRGLGDWVAQEASLRLTHMRLVESFVATTGDYIPAKPSFERMTEVTMLMFDVLARLGGDKLPGRPRLGDRAVRITIGDPIEVDQYWSQYRENRRSARQAVAAVTDQLAQALEAMIV